MANPRRVDFYLLSSKHGDGIDFVCRLLEKALRTTPHIVVAAEKALSSRLDTRLWTFKPESFLPHTLGNTQSPLQKNIQITDNIAAVATQTLIVNLMPDAVAPSISTPRILEIVPADASSKQLGRHRYRAYREWGDNLSNHQL